MCKASVVIPYYKKKKYLKKTVLSVLNQTYKKFEIIIVYDDDSKEDLQFVQSIKKLDNRIKLYVNKKNIGAGLSRNFGISKSLGSYICFIDADDIWKKNKLKDQINFMKECNISASHTSYEIKNKYDKIIGQRHAKNINSFEKLLKSCDIGLSTVIIKKNILKNNLKFAQLKTKEDYVLWLNLVKKGFIIHSLNKNLTVWNKTPGSLSSSIIQKLKDSFFVYYRYMHFGVTKSIYLTLILSLNFLKKNYKNS
tara:strand:+ start:439 stop:1194 length:756 start_codon:yes stop_codon:yes gene_type:complete